MLYSVVIPCYRSDQTIEHVVDQTSKTWQGKCGICTGQ